MAWRPLYHPQVGQTTCGSLALWHCGHTLRAGALKVQALARRLRLLDFEVFFLGTAMAQFLCLSGVERLSAPGLSGAGELSRQRDGRPVFRPVHSARGLKSLRAGTAVRMAAP